MIPPPPLHLPLSSSPPSDALSLLLFHPRVSTSQTACFFMPSSFLSPSVFTPYPTLLLSVWHQRAGTLEGVVVWRGQLTPPTPLQSMCITAKHNGEPCECHQYAARGDVVTPQIKWFSKWHTILRLQLMFSHYDSQSLKKKKPIINSQSILKLLVLSDQQYESQFNLQ